MKKIQIIIAVLVLLGCARVSVETKEPIKVDISMRVDIYQHVMKDIDDIESMVSGKEEKPAGKDNQSFNFGLLSDAYAQDLSSAVAQAAQGRKARYDQITQLQAKGVLGENNSGLIEVRKSADSNTENMVRNENNDRMVIYKELASKNGVSVDEIKRLYAQRLQKDAPAGTPVQDAGGNWSIK